MIVPTSTCVQSRFKHLAKITILLSLLVAVVLLALGEASPRLTADDKKEASSLPADLAAVPGDAVAFVSIRLADLWNAPYMKESRQEMAEDLKKRRDETGLGPEQIERVTIVFPTARDIYEQLFVISTFKPYDKKKLRLCLGNPDESQVNGRTYYTAPFSVAALYLLNDRVFLFGAPKAFGCFFRERRGANKTALQESLATAAKKHLAVAGINGRRIDKELPDLAADVSPLLAFLLIKPQSITLTWDLDEEDRGDAVLTFDSEDTAKEGERVMHDFVPWLRMESDVYLKNLPGRNRDPLAAPVEKLQILLRDAKIQRKGAAVRASVRKRTDLGSAISPLVESLLRRQ
jgi:hypothetical protein